VVSISMLASLAIGVLSSWFSPSFGPLTARSSIDDTVKNIVVLLLYLDTLRSIRTTSGYIIILGCCTSLFASRLIGEELTVPRYMIDDHKISHHVETRP